MSITKIHDHHAVTAHDGAAANGPWIDTFPGNALSFFLNVPTGYLSGNHVFKVQCAEADPANPQVPDNTTWADLHDGGGCSKDAPGDLVAVTVTDADAGHVVELSPDMCGCKFIRLVADAADLGVVSIALFESLRRSE